MKRLVNLNFIKLLSIKQIPVSTIRHKPICVVSTNLSAGKIDEKFGLDLTRLISEILSKPEKNITVILHADKQMWKNGSSKPMASVDIWSIGVFSPEKNEIYTPKFYKFFTEKLSLQDERINLVFHPLELEQAGHLTQQRLKDEMKL